MKSPFLNKIFSKPSNYAKWFRETIQYFFKRFRSFNAKNLKSVGQRTAKLPPFKFGTIFRCLRKHFLPCHFLQRIVFLGEYEKKRPQKIDISLDNVQILHYIATHFIIVFPYRHAYQPKNRTNRRSLCKRFLSLHGVCTG